MDNINLFFFVSQLVYSLGKEHNWNASVISNLVLSHCFAYVPVNAVLLKQVLAWLYYMLFIEGSRQLLPIRPCTSVGYASSLDTLLRDTLDGLSRGMPWCPCKFTSPISNSKWRVQMDLIIEMLGCGNLWYASRGNTFRWFGVFAKSCIHQVYRLNLRQISALQSVSDSSSTDVNMQSC